MGIAGQVPAAVIDEWRLDLLAHVGRKAATWMEAAAARWI
jgi:hypothetical protein